MGRFLKFTMEEDLSEEKSEPKDTSVKRWMEKDFTFFSPHAQVIKNRIKCLKITLQSSWLAESVPDFGPPVLPIFRSNFKT